MGADDYKTSKDKLPLRVSYMDVLKQQNEISAAIKTANEDVVNDVMHAIDTYPDLSLAYLERESLKAHILNHLIKRDKI